MAICITLFLILSGFLYLNYKYQNPYKLIFVFGKKGSGKSCYMVRQMLRYLRRGWNVYTDMADVRIPGVRVIDVHRFATFRPEPHSLICLDEVGISMDSRSFKTFPPGLRDFFKYVRKMECVVIMNSQAYDVDKKVRDTTDSMLLLQSIGALISIARPIHRSITLTEPTSEAESRIADVLRFGNVFSWKFYWMPGYFRYFNSKSMPPRDVTPYLEVDDDPRYLHGPVYNFVKDVIDFVRTKAGSYKAHS